jgi:glycosyltransferase involved in cell wall biosynthesis
VAGVADDAIMPAVRARPLRALQLPALVVALTWGTWREVRRTRARVVNAHWIVPAGLIAALLRMVGGPPFVLTVHGADAYTLSSGPLRALKQAILRRADSVAPVSEDIARSLGLTTSPVLRMGVDSAAIRAAVEPRRPAPGQLLYVGRLADKKGVDVLLQALAQVPDAHLSVLGDGPDRAALQTLAARLHLDDRVTFAGRQPKAAVLQHLATATAVVIPSRVGSDGDQEGTPVVLMESMAAGVPVVASDLGGLGECVEDGRTGLLVPPGDVGALAEALQAVITGRVDLAEMGAQAAAEAAARLDIRAVAEAYEDLLRQAMA